MADRSQTDPAKLIRLRGEASAKADAAIKEADRLRDAFRGSGIYSPEFSWLQIRTTWENTRLGHPKIRVTCDGGYGIRSALAMAAHDLAWPRLDPHSRALKVEVFFVPDGKADLFKSDEGAVLIARIEPPWHDKP